ncbi:hypothetical protein C8046_11835 [Serinibacter arcticus]|uniref:Lipoprotein n=1 Tax=Serinibacter arcticus TaxID=1655435 RepID=A0A2U1ZWE5_9MICO|nr:hypothetical protein [Serinibacter arcticus]PWD51242.1 hypothetical protein C8046_11835 [Serinibacter arcticus]
MTPGPSSNGLRALLASLAVLPVLALAACSPSTDRYEIGDRDEDRVRDVVTSYLDALAEGDAETALELLGVAAHETVCPDLVTNAVYGEVAGRPVDGEITDITVTAGSLRVGRPTATVAVEHAWDGEETLRRAQVALVRGDDGWQVEEDGALGLQRVELGIDGGAVLALDGACHASPGEASSVTVLPGTYSVTVEDTAGIGTVEPFEHQVPGSDYTLVQLQPRPEVVSDVTGQLTAWIDACAADPLADATCPDGVDTVLRRLDITERDPVEDRDVGLFLTRDGWAYSLTGSQEIRGTLRADGCIGQGERCVPGAPRSDLVSYRLTGTVTLDDDGAVVLTPSS